MILPFTVAVASAGVLACESEPEKLCEDASLSLDELKAQQVCETACAQLDECPGAAADCLDSCEDSRDFAISVGVNVGTKCVLVHDAYWTCIGAKTCEELSNNPCMEEHFAWIGCPLDCGEEVNDM